MKWIMLKITLFFTFAVIIAAESPGFSDAVSRSLPSVIYIESYLISNGKKKQSGFGSGTVFSDRGHIITNHHVVKNADYYEAVMYDGTRCTFKKYPGNRYYISDSETDLALMRLDCKNYLYKPIEKEKDNNLKKGDWVIAIGNPYGLSNSVTKGIVSSTNRSDVGFANIEDFIQSDVPINPGNSGGPLINTSGKMVGLNTAIRTVSGGFQGISFSIPVNIVESVYTDLLRFGHVRRGWIGVMVTEKSLAATGRKAVTVVSTLENSPAQLIGLQKGDIIAEVDNNTIESKSELTKIVKNKPIGARVDLCVFRSGILKRFSFTMNEKDYFAKVGEAINTLYSVYGIRLDINASNDKIIIADMSRFRYSENKLLQGDVITALNGQSVENLSDFASVLRRYKYKISFLEVNRNEKKIIIRLKNY